MLLKSFVEHFKQQYGVEAIGALHHNKRKTNYHIHLIFSERKLLKEPIDKVATRNMFYNEMGKHVRTKKEILDQAGQLKNGCKIISKGDIYERQIFTTKNAEFKSEMFLEEVKTSFTNLINLYVQDLRTEQFVVLRAGRRSLLEMFVIRATVNIENSAKSFNGMFKPENVDSIQSLAE